MANSKAVRDDLDRLLKQIQDDAYQRGWHDAVANIMESAQKLSASASPVEARPSAKRRATGKRIRRGAVPRTIMKILRHHDGLTYNEITKEAQTAGKIIPAPSIRSAMRRLHQDGEVRREGRRWFLAQQLLTRVGERESVDADTSTPLRQPQTKEEFMPPP